MPKVFCENTECVNREASSGTCTLEEVHLDDCGDCADFDEI